MYHVIMNCYITFTAKSNKKKERRQVNETFYKLERVHVHVHVYRDCIKMTRDKTRIDSIPHDAPDQMRKYGISESIRVMSSGAVFCQLSTLKSIVTLTVRVQYEDYHSTTLTPPCQSIRVCQYAYSTRITLI